MSGILLPAPVNSVNGQTGDVVIDADSILPDQTGNSGKVLKTDGSNASWQDSSAATNGVPAGGSTGQVLSKASATDYDTQWETLTIPTALADLLDDSNHRLVTDAQLTVIGNTSGTNTGDNATNSQYSGLDAAKANVTLNNLASVAINTSLLFDTDSAYNIGDATHYVANIFSDKIYLNSTASLDGSVAGQLKVTGDMVFSSGGDIVLYNTTDEVTNWTKGWFYWSSNALTIETTRQGTAPVRNIQIKSNLSVWTLLADAGKTSGIDVLFDFSSWVFQGGTAGYTGIKLNAFENTTGSGTKRLIDLQVSSSTKFNVTNQGNMTIAGGGIATLSNANLSLVPNGTGYTIIGDAGTTSHSFNTNDDLLVSGRLEVDGASYFDNSINSSITTGQISIQNITDGSGLVLAGVGNSITSKLRIVSNANAWADTVATAYFQIDNSTNHYATFMSGGYGSDVKFGRLQFVSTHTSFTDLAYTATPVPDSLIEIVGGSNQKLLKVKAYSSQTVNLQEWQNSSGSALLSIDSSGNFIFADAKNIVLNTTTGTKIGTATGQKLGFWNATPVAQQVLATGASHTVDDVISALQTLGLFKQS